MRTALSPLRIVVWYSDGHTGTCDATASAWAALPSAGVQIVQVLYNFNYKGKYLQDLLSSGDYYWYHSSVPPDNVLGWECGSAGQIPLDTVAANIKQGEAIAVETFVSMYNSASTGVVVG